MDTRGKSKRAPSAPPSQPYGKKGRGKGKGKTSQPAPSTSGIQQEKQDNSEMLQKLLQQQQEMQAQLDEFKKAKDPADSGAPATPNLGEVTETQEHYGTGQSAFISVTHEPDAHVPASIKTKIAKSEYINLAYLLEGSLDLNTEQTFGIKVSGVQAIGGNEMGNIVLRGPGPKRRIDSIDTWTDAFLVFTYTFGKSHPERQSELLAYIRNVRRAGKYGGIGYKLYDEKFRMAQADNPGRSWATIDSELWLIYVGARGPPPTSTFRAQPAQPGGPKRKGTCNQFNQKGSCSFGEEACHYQHKCAKCRSSEHGAYACKSGK